MTTTEAAPPRSDFVTMVLETTRRVFDKQHRALEGDDLPAHALVQGADGTMTYLHLALCMTPGSGKDDAASAIRHQVLETRATALAFVSETWMVPRGEGQPRPTGYYGDHPDRVEMLMVLVEEQGHEPRAFSARITRSADQRTLEEWRQDGQQGGRFTGLLPRASAAVAYDDGSLRGEA